MEKCIIVCINSITLTAVSTLQLQKESDYLDVGGATTVGS